MWHVVSAEGAPIPHFFPPFFACALGFVFPESAHFLGSFFFCSFASRDSTAICAVFPVVNELVQLCVDVAHLVVVTLGLHGLS